MNDIELKKYQSKIFKDTSRFRAVAAGRRFGKTYELFCEIVNQIRIANTKVTYATPTRDMFLQIMLPILLKHLPTSIYRLNRTLWTFDFVNGSNLYLKSTNHYDTAFRGTENDLLIFDEVKDTEREAWTEAAFPTLTNRQGRALLVGTPDGRGWFYDVFNDVDFSSHHYTTLQGGYVSETELELARRQLDERTFKQEFEASFETFSNIAYYCFTNNNITDIAYNNSAYSYLCWDFNASECPMSVALVQKIENKLVVVKEFVYQYTNTYDMCESITKFFTDTNFNGSLEITGDWAGRQTKSSATRTDYQIIDYYFKNYKNYYVKIRPTISIKDRVNSLNSLLKAYDGTIKLWINKECIKLINDFNRVEFLENGTQLNGKDKQLTHISDALSYFAYNYYPADIKAQTVIGN